jgi:hypothetical protein
MAELPEVPKIENVLGSEIFFTTLVTLDHLSL